VASHNCWVCSNLLWMFTARRYKGMNLTYNPTKYVIKSIFATLPWQQLYIVLEIGVASVCSALNNKYSERGWSLPHTWQGSHTMWRSPEFGDCGGSQNAISRRDENVLCKSVTGFVVNPTQMMSKVKRLTVNTSATQISILGSQFEMNINSSLTDLGQLHVFL